MSTCLSQWHPAELKSAAWHVFITVTSHPTQECCMACVYHCGTPPSLRVLHGMCLSLWHPTGLKLNCTGQDWECAGSFNGCMQLPSTQLRV